MPQPVTKETLETALATQADLRFQHKILRNADGTRQRARATGAMQTWKQAPDRFSLPIKKGYPGIWLEYGAITEMNMNEWELL